MVRVLVLTRGCVWCVWCVLCGALSACAGTARGAGAGGEAMCNGLDEPRGGPLAAQDVENVAPLYDLETVNKVQVYRLKGAELDVAAPLGTGDRGFVRKVECGVGRRGGDDGDPLASARSAAVHRTDTGYTVEIRGETTADAHEILRRSNELTVTPPAPAANGLNAGR